jgi:two-component system sensor histidine kinase/response regulator
MDVQMPEMDGLEAVAAIRAEEKKRPGAHLPVIAMTAYTMKGDRERFLEAGFDGYVRKPISVHELFETIEATVPVRAKARMASGMPPALPAPPASLPSPPRGSGDSASIASRERPPAFDKRAAVGRLAGDEELLKDLTEVFLVELPAWMKDLRGAVAGRDAALLKRAAHTLKGGVDSIGGAEAYAAALELERMGREADLAGVEQALDRLEADIGRLVPHLRALVAAG